MSGKAFSKLKSVRLTDVEHKRIIKISKRLRISPSELIRRALADFCELATSPEK